MSRGSPTRSTSRRSELVAFAVVAGAFGIIDWVAAVALGWQCPMRGATGLLCPACGATHAVSALLHGQVWHALGCNALVLTVPAVVLMAAFWRRIPSVGSDRFVTLLLGLALAFTVLRNLPSLGCLRLT